MPGKLKAIAWLTGSRTVDSGISVSLERKSLKAYSSSEPLASFPLMMRFDSAGCRPMPDVMADEEASDIFSWLSTKSFIFWSMGSMVQVTGFPVCSSMTSTVWKNLPAFSLPDRTSVREVRNLSVIFRISSSIFASSEAHSGWIFLSHSRLFSQ